MASIDNVVQYVATLKEKQRFLKIKLAELEKVQLEGDSVGDSQILEGSNNDNSFIKNKDNDNSKTTANNNSSMLSDESSTDVTFGNSQILEDSNNK